METSEEVRQLDGIKVYIIESLRPGDKRTGEDLKDTLRQMCIDKGFSFSEFDYLYLPVDDKSSLAEAFENIEKEVKYNNIFPIVQLECHGYENGIGLQVSSGEKVEWEELFNCLRSINIASSNLLMLNLSMCFGEYVVRYINSKERAPFRGVVCTQGKVYYETLENAWKHFSENLIDSSAEYGFSKLAQESNLLYLSQDFIFDWHFNLKKQDPEIFDNYREKELEEMYLQEGTLAIDVNLYKEWVAKEQAKIKEKYKGYFCFKI